MRDLAFFQEIEHTQVPWGDRQIWVPVFYYDFMTLGTYWLAPFEKVKALLPSNRMIPYRVSPWHTLVSITVYEYRDCDIGPYNEVSFSIPFTLDRASPLLTGILRKAPQVPMVYIHHLPVTTEIARDAGVEFAGYPKFVADIRFEEEGDWVHCSATEGGREILTLSGRKLPLALTPRSRVHPTNCRGERLLRCELILSERQAGASRDAADVRLELGNHPMAQDLRDLELGRLLAYQFCPQQQAILTPVLESHPA